MMQLMKYIIKFKSSIDRATVRNIVQHAYEKMQKEA